MWRSVYLTRLGEDADDGVGFTEQRHLSAQNRFASLTSEKGLRQVQIELTQVRAEEAPPLVVDVVLARA